MKFFQNTLAVLALSGIAVSALSTSYTYVDLGAYNPAYALTDGTSGYIVGTNLSNSTGYDQAFYMSFNGTTIGSLNLAPLRSTYQVGYGTGVANLGAGVYELVGHDEGGVSGGMTNPPVAITCLFTSSTAATPGAWSQTRRPKAGSRSSG